MKELYELKETLCDKLKEYGKQRELTANSLDIVDKLAHAVKNIDKIIESSEGGEYSERYPMMMYRDGSYGDHSYYGDGSSYGRGRNARRDSMGRYAREGRYYRADEDFKTKLHELMADAPDDHTRKEIERLANNM
jgi:hypothetical protein